MSEEVYRVEIRNAVNGQLRHADLVFRNLVPFIVLSWEGVDGSREPSVVAGINPDGLTKLVSNSPLLPHYFYNGTVGGLDLVLPE